MNKYIVLLLIICASTSAQLAHVKKLDWIDPRGRQPVDYVMWYHDHVVDNGRSGVRPGN